MAGASVRGDVRCRRAAIVWVVTVCALFLTASRTQAASEVTYRDGQLWLAVDEAPAEAIFASISKTTGMTIVAPPSSRAKVVSVTAAGVSVQAAIERLLRTAGYSNYVLVFEADGHARRLLVLDRDRVPSPSGSPVSHVNGDLAPTVRIDAPATARSFDLPVIGQAPTAAHASTPPASMGSATPRGSSAVPNRALQDAGQRIRQRMAAWNTLSAPERQQIREYLRQLPLAERVELTVYLRHHALGQPLDD